MNCPYCGEEMEAGRLHFCPEKPNMISVTWEQIKNFWRWINGTKKKEGQGEETKKTDESSGHGQEGEIGKIEP